MSKSNTKQTYHHGNLKSELIKVAFDFILKEGIDKLTLKVLADTTNTSRSAIYRHFKNKDELIETIIQDGFDKFDDALAPILLDTNKALIDRFYLATQAYIEWAKANPNLYRLLFGEKYSYLRESLMSIKDESCGGFSALKLAIEEGQKSGIVKKEDSYRQAIIVWASIHGLASLIIDGFLDIQEIYQELYTKMFQSLLDALVTDKIKVVSSIPFVKKLLFYSL